MTSLHGLGAGLVDIVNAAASAPALWMSTISLMSDSGMSVTMIFRRFAVRAMW